MVAEPSAMAPYVVFCESTELLTAVLPYDAHTPLAVPRMPTLLNDAVTVPAVELILTPEAAVVMVVLRTTRFPLLVSDILIPFCVKPDIVQFSTTSIPPPR